MPTINTLFGKPIVNYDLNDNKLELDENIYRVAFDWQIEQDYEELFADLVKNPQAASMETLIIGSVVEDEMLMNDAVTTLVESKDAFPNLKALFVGDISYEESEISWIQNTDMGPVLEAFPKLEYFRVRGGNDLRFQTKGHAALKTLIVETGGMELATIQDIIAMDLPELTTLELWLGTSDYGFGGDIESLKPLIIGKPYPDGSYPFPKLEHLGLRNSEIADEIAEAFMDAPILSQLKVLDLSMGTMTERGARALLENEEISSVGRLNLSNNYINDEEVMERLGALGAEVSLAGQKKEEDYGRYVDVGE